MEPSLRAYKEFLVMQYNKILIRVQTRLYLIGFLITFISKRAGAD